VTHPADIDALVTRIRAEADMASRAGQYADLNEIADDLAALAPGRQGLMTDEYAWPPTGWCAAISPELTHLCHKPRGHAGDHAGPEMPTVEIDEPTSVAPPGYCADCPDHEACSTATRATL
jgi:hypothetical protein